MAAENYTIREFMNAMFKDDRSVMSEDEFNAVYTEYVDIAGLYDTDVFNKRVYIHYLMARINCVKLFCKMQRDFIKEFGIPYVDYFYIVEPYGFSFLWKGSKEDFEKRLLRFEQSEKRYVSELENNLKNLEEEKEKNKGKQLKKPKRSGFIKTINSLNKAGYRIDNDKTTVEELAYMIKQETESET